MPNLLLEMESDHAVLNNLSEAEPQRGYCALVQSIVQRNELLHAAYYKKPPKKHQIVIVVPEPLQEAIRRKRAFLRDDCSISFEYCVLRLLRLD